MKIKVLAPLNNISFNHNDEIHGVEQMLYGDRKKMGFGISIEEQRIYWEQYLEDKIKTIERTKRHAGDLNVDWWGIFFEHQHTILQNYIARYWPLQF